MRFIGGTAPRDGAWRSMAVIAGAWSLLGYSMFSVIEKDTGRWIGRLGPWRPGGTEGGWPGNEVGWALIPDVRGRGYAAEGATAPMCRCLLLSTPLSISTAKPASSGACVGHDPAAAPRTERTTTLLRVSSYIGDSRIQGGTTVPIDSV